jgi:hypothetical protein
MTNFIIGFVFGIVVATVGFTGGFAAGFVVGFCALDAEDNKPTSASVLKMDKFFMSNNLYVIKQVQRTLLVR